MELAPKGKKKRGLRSQGQAGCMVLKILVLSVDDYEIEEREMKIDVIIDYRNKVV